MKTKLEAIAGLLAGRADSPEALLAELADPTSEASLFLEATRTKSRALLAKPRVADAPAKPGRLGSRRLVGLLIAGGLATLVLAVAVPLRVGAIRQARLEAALADQHRQAEADRTRLEAALARAVEVLRPAESPPSREPAIEASIASLEAMLLEQARRLDDLARAMPPASSPPGMVPGPSRPDPALAEIRAELAAIRREAAANELAGGRQFQELRTIVQELNQVLRRLLGRPDGPPGDGPRSLRMPGR